MTSNWLAAVLSANQKPCFKLLCAEGHWLCWKLSNWQHSTPSVIIKQSIKQPFISAFFEHNIKSNTSNRQKAHLKRFLNFMQIIHIDATWTSWATGSACVHKITICYLLSINICKETIHHFFAIMSNNLKLVGFRKLFPGMFQNHL